MGGRTPSDPPQVHGPPSEERPYLGFVAAALAMAMAMALGAGLVLALLIPLGPVLNWRMDDQALVQAHGWAQLGGWLGLFVAGMALRLVRRLATGRRCPPGSGPPCCARWPPQPCCA